MKKFASLIILGLAFAPQVMASGGMGPGPGLGEPVSGGLVCSGDASDGATESYEAGEGSFCTTDWLEFDTSGVIDTYATTGANCGTHALAITANSANAAASNRVVVDLGATYPIIRERMYVTLPVLSDGAYIRFKTVGNDNNERDGGNYYLQWYRLGSTYQLKIRTGAGQPTDYYPLQPGTRYRLEIYSDSTPGQQVTLKVYDTAGTAVADSDANNIVSYTCSNVVQRYVSFYDYHSAAANVTTYIDDYTVRIGGTGDIGAQVCN